MKEIRVCCISISEAGDELANAIPGSAVMDCHRCHVKVVVSPSTIALSTGHKLMPHCMGCMDALIREGGTMVTNLRPEQRRELEKYGIDTTAAQDALEELANTVVH